MAHVDKDIYNLSFDIDFIPDQQLFQFGEQFRVENALLNVIQRTRTQVRQNPACLPSYASLFMSGQPQQQS